MKRLGPNDVPVSIVNAAEQVESYFLNRGTLSWCLGNLQSRYRGPPPAADPRAVDATHRDLYRALTAKDSPPLDLAQAVDAVVMHLGLCALGGRIVRLRLPNGETLRVTLE